MEALGDMIKELREELRVSINENVLLNKKIEELNIKVTHIQEMSEERLVGRREEQILEPPVLEREGSRQRGDSGLGAIGGLKSLILPVPLAPPERFSGEAKRFQTFFTQCELHFLSRPEVFSSDMSKITFMISYLSGEAASWAGVLVKQKDLALYDFKLFKEEFSKLFDKRQESLQVDGELLELKQGNRELVSYITQFKTLVVESNWPEEKRASLFYRGLRDELKDALSGVVNRPTSCDALMDLVVQLDFRLYERRLERRRGDNKQENKSNPRFDRPRLEFVNRDFRSKNSESSGRIRGPLSKEERDRRRNNNLCLYCGRSGHFLGNCPYTPKKVQNPDGKNHQVANTLQAAVPHITINVSLIF